MADIIQALVSILLFLDSLIYSLINWVYQIILILCQVDILNNTFEVQGLINRLYVIIGVVVLFVVAYSLLRSMVNPDDAIKGKKSPVTIIRDVLISIVAIALVPTIFSVASRFQNAILLENTIGKIILGDTINAGDVTYDSDETVRNGGMEIASNVLRAFLHPVYSECNLVGSEYDCSNVKVNTMGVGIPFIFSIPVVSDNYDDIWQEIYDSGNFLNITIFSYSIAHDGNITYYYLISTLVGAFVLLVLLSYCIDIAIRTIKLAVYQLIAPLPILARIAPGEQGSKIFSNWLKATISTYLEVFIRLAILFFAVLMVKLVVQNLPTLLIGGGFISGNAGFTVYLFAQLFLIVGIILFVKQAPGLIKEITGLDGGKYNVFKSAAQGLALIGGTAAGRSPLAGVRAWEETGKDGSLRSIGHQANRRAARIQAREEGATIRDRMADRARVAFGYGTAKERADRLLEKNRDLSGNYFTVNNDTTSDIKLRDQDGKIIATLVSAGAKGIELNESTIQKLNEAKSNNAIEVSRIAEETKKLQNINEANKRVNVKGEAEDLAKKEMAKGAFWLRGEDGKVLTYTKADGEVVGKTVTSDGKEIGWTQKQWEDWFAGNREKLSDTERAVVTNMLDKSINDHTIKAFYDLNGENEPGGKINEDNIKNRNIFAQQLRLIGVRNEKGEIQHKIKVDVGTAKEREIDIDHLANNAQDITFDDVKAIKGYVEDVERSLAAKLNSFNIEKEGIDAENAAISRLEAQGKERGESVRAGQRYQAVKAASDANSIEDRGKKG